MVVFGCLRSASSVLDSLLGLIWVVLELFRLFQVVVGGFMFFQVVRTAQVVEVVDVVKIVRLFRKHIFEFGSECVGRPGCANLFQVV